MFNNSLKEFGIQNTFKDIIDAYFYFKRNSKLFYRISLENYTSYFRAFSSKSSRIKVFTGAFPSIESK